MAYACPVEFKHLTFYFKTISSAAYSGINCMHFGREKFPCVYILVFMFLNFTFVCVFSFFNFIFMWITFFTEICACNRIRSCQFPSLMRYCQLGKQENTLLSPQFKYNILCYTHEFFFFYFEINYKIIFYIFFSVLFYFLTWNI